MDKHASFVSELESKEATREQLEAVTDAILFVMAPWCGHCVRERDLVNRFKHAEGLLIRDTASGAATSVVVPRVLWALGTSSSEGGQAEVLASVGVVPRAFPTIYLRTRGVYRQVDDSVIESMRSALQGNEQCKSFGPLLSHYLLQKR
jgi:hypothetical protein